MSKIKAVDMTAGDPTRHLIGFALPLLAGNLFQQLYNMIDSLVVGNYVGANALAAIGTCSSLNFLLFSLSFGLANGVGIIVSQHFGAKDEDRVTRTIANSFYVLTITSLIVCLIGILLAKPLLVLMDTPEEILPNSVTYLRTTCCGMLFIALYNDVAATLRALGDSKTPLYFLIMSSLLNVGLDLTFVLVFGLGVFGVALATVIAQFISAAVSLTYAFAKVPFYRMTKDQMQPRKEIVIHCFRLGIPMALQSSMIAISLVILQGVVNGFGSVVMAAYTISSKVDIVISQVYQAMNMALTTFSGQNLGAGKMSRVKKGFWRGVLIVTVYNCLMIPAVFVGSHGIVSLFVSEPEVIEIGTKAVRIASVMYFGLGLIYIPRGVLNGLGDAKFALINGLTEVICRIIYSNVLTNIPVIGIWGIWLAAGFTWVTTAIVCMLRYFGGRWRKKVLTQRGFDPEAVLE